MAYVRRKKVGNHEYYQIVRGYRENGKVKQRVVAHLGPHKTPEAAIAYWQGRVDWYREHARNLQHAAQYIREGHASSPYYGGRRQKRLVPRHGTPLDSTCPVGGRYAPRGWFYSKGMADEVEEEAREYLAKAAQWEERIARLRDVYSPTT
jgi:hypothetical protein